MIYDNSAAGHMADGICIYFPKAYSTDDRTTEIERPLADLLPAAIARVDGGGTWFHGASDVWVYTSSLTLILPIVRSFLSTANVPSGTQLQYIMHGVDHHDDLVDGEWRIGLRSLGSLLGLSIAA